MDKPRHSNRCSTLETLPDVGRILVVEALQLLVELFVLKGC
jgi:hypothetical protein